MPTDSLKASDKMAILIRVATAVSDRPIFHSKTDKGKFGI